MSTTRTADRLPTAIYAAAGAGEFAYEQLRKLPSTLIALRGQLGSVDRDTFDVPALRKAARRNAAALVTSAAQSRQKAAALYEDLVTRGEKVVRGAQHTVKTTVIPVVSAAASAPTGQARRVAAARRTSTTSGRSRPVASTAPASGTSPARKPRSSQKS